MEDKEFGQVEIKELVKATQVLIRHGINGVAITLLQEIEKNLKE